MTSKVALTDLIEDFEVYPRHAVDTSWVAELARTITAGTALPPVVADAATKRIVDGFHRVRAYRKVLGRGGEIEVDLRKFANEAELVKTAVELNATHGRKFDQQDRSRSAILLERVGVSIVDIAATLHTTEDRARELLARVVLVKADDQPPEKWPAKPVVYPTADGPRTLTPSQFEVMHASGGLRPTQTVTQLIRELESKLIDLEDAGLVTKLWRLHDVLEETLPVRT